MSETYDRNDPEYRLLRYVDGDMSPDEARQLEVDLARDPAVAEELRRYRALDDRLARLHPGFGEDDYRRQREAIVSAVERESLRTGVPRRRRRPLGVPIKAWGALAAAAAVVVAIAVAMYAPPEPARPQVVDVHMIPPEGQPANGGQVVAVTREVGPERLPLALPDEIRAARSLPPGTVLVSVAAPGQDESSDQVEVFPVGL